LDRLARNPVDGGSVIWAIKQHGLEVVTPTQNFSPADDNAILMYIEFGMAQKYIDDLSRNVKRGLRTKAEKGWCPYAPPLGYLNSKTGAKGEKTILADPERFALVRRIWDLALTGRFAPPRILQIATDQWGLRTRQARKLGNKPLARSGIYRLLTDPFYYGWFEYPRGSNNWYKGNHKPMVTQEEFDRVQVFLGQKSKPRPIVRSFPFTGLIRCGECDASVTAEEKHQLICPVCRLKFAHSKKDRCPRCATLIDRMKDPTLLHYTYYHCTKRKTPNCSQRSVDSHALDRQISDYLGRISLSERFRDWALARLREYNEQEISARDAILHSQQRGYQDCLARLQNLIRLKTAPENVNGALISDDEYARQRSELSQEKARLEELLRDTGHTVNRWIELAERTFEFACAAPRLFAKGDPSIQKTILAALGSNLTLRDKKLIIEAHKPFSILAGSLPQLATALERFEPKPSRISPGLSARTASPRPTKLPQRDDVRTYAVTPEELVRQVFLAVRESDPPFWLPDLFALRFLEKAA
ncbi:MAG: recombinase family protein, partial [Vicinamibacteria bacterium]